MNTRQATTPAALSYNFTVAGDEGLGLTLVRSCIQVDATVAGNMARFMNHSCAPNAYSKVIEVGKGKHIVVFALRDLEVRINHVVNSTNSILYRWFQKETHTTNSVVRLNQTHSAIHNVCGLCVPRRRCPVVPLSLVFPFFSCTGGGGAAVRLPIRAGRRQDRVPLRRSELLGPNELIG